MKHKLHVVDEKIRLTDDLTLSANNLRIPLADFITRLIQSVAVSNSQTGDLLSLREQKSHVDAITVDLKELSPVIVALDKQKIPLAKYKSHVLPWRIATANQYGQAWKQLMTRLIVVALIIGLLLATGQLSRRLALRHVHDPNRRRFISMSYQFSDSVRHYGCRRIRAGIGLEVGRNLLWAFERRTFARTRKRHSCHSRVSSVGWEAWNQNWRPGTGLRGHRRCHRYGPVAIPVEGI
jgi:hypothetical protein